MNEAVIRLNGVFIYGFGLLTVLSFLWGAFVFYKKALGSHFEDAHVLDAVITAAFWSFIAGRLGFVIFNLGTFWNHWPRIFLLSNYPGLDRWGAIAGLALGVFWVARRLKARFLDWFDLSCLGILAGEAVFLAGLAWLTGWLGYLLLAGLYLGLFIWFWQVEDRYRTYEWYRVKRTSARSGLIAGLSIGAWGLIFITEKIIFRQVTAGTLLWGVTLVVGGVVLVYIRSGRTVTEDIKIIFKHGRK